MQKINRSPKRQGRNIAILLTVILGISVSVYQSCKKPESSKKSTSSANRSMFRTDPTKTYSMADYQQAFDDVQLDGAGHMIFNNMNQLDVVLRAVDSLGDSVAISWQNSISFSSIGLQYSNVMSAYSQLMGGQPTMAQVQQFWSANANVAIIDQNTSEVNTSEPTIAWVLGSDHIAYVDDITLYSDRSNFITLPTVIDNTIPNYVAGTSSVNDDVHRIYAAKSIWSNYSNQLCTTGLYLGTQTYNMNDLQCGSPLQRKTTANCQVVNGLAWGTCGGSGWIRQLVNVHNYRRGAFGFWYNDTRYDHVYGYFGPGTGVYYNWTMNCTSGTFYVFNQYYSCLSASNLNQLVAASFCFKNGAVCSYPMCNTTICQNF